MRPAPWLSKRVLTLFFLLWLLPGTAPALSPRTLVVLSSNLKAFYEFYQGFREEERRQGETPRALLLPESPFLEAEILRFRPEVVVAVGPEAVRALRPLSPKILPPGALFPALVLRAPERCALLLEPPPAEEARRLARALRDLLPDTKVRVLLPCRRCARARALARELAPCLKASVCPVKDLSRELPGIFKRDEEVIYLLPEALPYAPALVDYLVKQSLYHRKVLFGFSEYFCRRGAALCWKRDYREAGRLLARFLRRSVRKNCPLFVPLEAEANPKILRRVRPK